MTARPGHPDPLAFLDDEVAALRERHLYRPLRVMSSAQGPIVSVDDRRLISLSSNDYLGLTHHPRLRDAAIAYWALLHDTVAACQPAGTAEAAVLRRSAAIWGTVYGIARLTALGQIPASVPSDEGDLLREAISTLYEGWQTDRLPPS